MRVILNSSYVLLWCLTIGISTLLRRLVDELRRISHAMELPHTQKMNVPSPYFSAPLVVIGSDGSTSSICIGLEDLKGREAALLFIDAADVPSQTTYRDIRLSSSSLTHHVKGGTVYVICTGDHSQCHDIALNAFDEFLAFPILVDDKAEISKAFGILHTPHAVLLDGKSRIVKRGYAMRLHPTTTPTSELA